MPVLEQRLQIPNQTGVVRQELALALEESGAARAEPGPPASVPGHGLGHGRGSLRGAGGNGG